MQTVGYSQKNAGYSKARDTGPPDALGNIYDILLRISSPVSKTKEEPSQRGGAVLQSSSSYAAPLTKRRAHSAMGEPNRQTSSGGATVTKESSILQPALNQSNVTVTVHDILRRRRGKSSEAPSDRNISDADIRARIRRGLQNQKQKIDPTRAALLAAREVEIERQQMLLKERALMEACGAWRKSYNQLRRKAESSGSDVQLPSRVLDALRGLPTSYLVAAGLLGGAGNGSDNGGTAISIKTQNKPAEGNNSSTQPSRGESKCEIPNAVSARQDAELRIRRQRVPVQVTINPQTMTLARASPVSSVPSNGSNSSNSSNSGYQASANSSIATKEDTTTNKGFHSERPTTTAPTSSIPVQRPASPVRPSTASTSTAHWVPPPPPAPAPAPTNNTSANTFTQQYPAFATNRTIDIYSASRVAGYTTTNTAQRPPTGATRTGPVQKQPKRTPLWIRRRSHLAEFVDIPVLDEVRRLNYGW